MLAVLGGHTDCVHFLLEKGALPDAKDKRGSTALHRGVGQKHCMGLHTVAEHQLDHTSLYKTIDWIEVQVLFNAVQANNDDTKPLQLTT